MRSDEDDRALPCRLTIVDSNGSLMTVGAASREGLAVRPGVIYTSDGRAEFGRLDLRYAGWPQGFSGVGGISRQRRTCGAPGRSDRIRHRPSRFVRSGR